MPCTAHILNLIGVHATRVSIILISFFGVVQNIFIIFSGLKKHWEILMNCLKVILKTHSDTCWV